jgi:hypothetical protein
MCIGRCAVVILSETLIGVFKSTAEVAASIARTRDAARERSEFLWMLQGSAESNYSQHSSDLSLEEDSESRQRETERHALTMLDKARVSQRFLLHDELRAHDMMRCSC